jgi:hypothetical protein
MCIESAIYKNDFHVRVLDCRLIWKLPALTLTRVSPSVVRMSDQGGVDSRSLSDSHGRRVKVAAGNKGLLELDQSKLLHHPATHHIKGDQ